MPSRWVELSLAHEQLSLFHIQDGFSFENIGASPENSTWDNSLSCEADTSARQLPGLWNRFPELGASNYVEQI